MVDIETWMEGLAERLTDKFGLCLLRWSADAMAEAGRAKDTKFP